MKAMNNAKDISVVVTTYNNPGFLELVLRIGAALLLPALLGYWGVYLAEIAAWVGAGVFLIIACYHRLHTLINATEKKI